MNDKEKEPGGKELLEGTLRRVVSNTIESTAGERMRAALALAVLLDEVSDKRAQTIRKIINAETDLVPG